MAGFVAGGQAITGSGAFQSHTKGESPWPWRRDLFVYRWRRHLPNTTDALKRAAQHIGTLAEHCGCDADDLADLEIAVREALANALQHGNRSEVHRVIRLRVYAAPDVGILIAVRDEGPGFDPREVPDPRPRSAWT